VQMLWLKTHRLFHMAVRFEHFVMYGTLVLCYYFSLRSLRNEKHQDLCSCDDWQNKVWRVWSFVVVHCRCCPSLVSDDLPLLCWQIFKLVFAHFAPGSDTYSCSFSKLPDWGKIHELPWRKDSSSSHTCQSFPSVYCPRRGWWCAMGWSHPLPR